MGMAADDVSSLHKSCGGRPVWMKADDLLCCRRPRNDPSLPLLSWTEYMRCGTGNLRSRIVPVISCTAAAPHHRLFCCHCCTEHGDDVHPFFLSVLAAQTPLIHGFNLSGGVDHLRSEIGSAPLIAGLSSSVNAGQCHRSPLYTTHGHIHGEAAPSSISFSILAIIHLTLRVLQITPEKG